MLNEGTKLEQCELHRMMENYKWLFLTPIDFDSYDGLETRSWACWVGNQPRILSMRFNFINLYN